MSEQHIHIHVHGGEGGASSSVDAPSRPKRASKPATPSRSKRKPSAYAKRYGRHFKALKKKHPKAKFATLSKRAHKLAKKK